MLRRTFALSVAALLAAACVHLDDPDYPADWPALAPRAAGCPRLTGRYDTIDFNDARPVPLARWFTDPRLALTALHRVALDGPADGRLVVRFLDAAGNVLGSQQWQEGADYDCADGTLRHLLPPFDFPGMVNRHAVRLSLTARGDLVIHDTDRGGGIVLFVPTYAAFGHWHLYRGREPSGAPAR